MYKFLKMKNNIFKISINTYIHYKREYKNTYNLLCPRIMRTYIILNTNNALKQKTNYIKSATERRFEIQEGKIVVSSKFEEVDLFKK